MPDRGRKTRAGWSRLWAVAFLVLLAGGCRSTSRVGDRYYANGRYPEAAAAYEVYIDSGTSGKDQTNRTLYRLGVVYATPGSSVYDPERSVEVLDRLLESCPDCSLAPEALLLRNLQLQVVDLSGELRADQMRLAELEASLAERQAKMAGLELQIGDRDEQITALQESIPPLRIEIRELIHELASKHEELEQLERLKAIDLEQPPP